MTRRIIFYAPNVHTGGGLVLLREMLAAWPADRSLVAYLDARARAALSIREDFTIRWVTPTLAGRLTAEIGLGRVCRSEDDVFCFHGLPPLFVGVRGLVRVFQQNKLCLDSTPLNRFPWRTRLRIFAERLISRWFRFRVAEYIVQTGAMQRALLDWYGSRTADRPRVTVFPFAERRDAAPPRGGEKTYDFVYVSDGSAHKNHQTLLRAWIRLAQDGFRPSLALTLGTRDERLIADITRSSAEHGLAITNVGVLDRSGIMHLYAASRALIFPSVSESFGLPLVEASHLGLPILASELDYVREVCAPTETFDPQSEVSIARAVRRFLGSPEPRLLVKDASAFLTEVIRP